MSEYIVNTKSQIDQRPIYTAEDVGCYVDGAHGIYAIDRIYTFAWQHGFKPTFGEAFGGKHKLSDYEFAGEIEEDIDDYMNENYMVHGAFWGRSEDGDWGLWSTED